MGAQNDGATVSPNAGSRARYPTHEGARACARKPEQIARSGTTEIAERLGLAHPETVHNWRRRYEDFPEPVAALGRALAWDWRDVERWARKTGRL